MGSNAAYEAYSNVVSYVVGNGSAVPPTAVSVSVSALSPQPEGAVVTLSAQASGGSGPYEYKFWIRKAGGEWVAVQGYWSFSIYTWNTTGFTGTNQIQVWARNMGSNAAYEAYSNVVSYVVGNGSAVPPTAVSVSVSALSPQPEGAVVTLSAQASGGSGPYEYMFWIRKEGGSWVAVRGYSSSTSYSWNTTGFSGTNQIQIWARNMGSSASYEAYSNAISYIVSK
jgi:hypothetical protein